MEIGAEVRDGVANSSEESAAATAASARERKKRKWDQPAELFIPAGLTSPGSLPFDAGNRTGIGTAPVSKSESVATVESVCTTASQLCNIPTLQKSAPPTSQKIRIQDELIAREIIINDADSSVRSKLTKRQAQEEIQRSTGAVVITRGKYRPPNTLPDNEKPLYLHISSGAHLKDTAERIKAVDRAASMVEEILKQGHSPSMVTTHSSPNSGGQVLQPLTKCLYLGFDPDPLVNIAARIRGPNDQYINHIMNETGASVMLMGNGSENFGIQKDREREQPLHLYISSSNQKSFKDAQILAENLLDTIALEVGATRSPLPSKFYQAVPPPRLIFLDDMESSVLSIDASTGKSSPSSSLQISLNNTRTRYVSQSMKISSYLPSSVSDGARYSGVGFYSTSGYEGIYPKATALQQVALALRGALVSADPASTVGYHGTSSNINLSSGAEYDKRPQRRKFQELPVASNGPFTLHQNSGQILDSPKISVSSDGLPERSDSSSLPPSNEKLPRQLPPIPKFSHPILTSRKKSPKAVTEEPIPDLLMKLMEYGDDDEDEYGEPTSDRKSTTS